MAERSSEIERHIELERRELGSNLQELETKVKSAFDWQGYFDRNPMMMLGLAFGGGIVAATLTGGRRNRRYDRDMGWRDREQARPSSAAVEHQKRKAAEVWENIKGALIGVAAARARTMLSETIPGFREHYDRTVVEASKPPHTDVHDRTLEPATPRI